MVFLGKQSSGCGLCRKRKVKCDETRPSCRRCDLYGSECPGYQRPLVVLFHTGRESLTRKRSSPEVESNSRASKGPLETPSSIVEQNAADRADANSVVRQPQPSWEDESITFFLHENCINPQPGVAFGHLDFLLDLYSSCGQTSCLRPATLATAYLSLSRHYKSRTLYLEARKYYGRALRSVYTSLSNPEYEQQDVTLSAIMLLSLIEDIDGEVPSVKTFHLWGLAQLFETQGHRLFCDIQRGSLCRWIFTQLTIYTFTTNQSLKCLYPPEIHVLDPDVRHLSHGIILIVAKLSHFYSEAAKHLASWTENPTASLENRISILSTIDQAMHLQAELSSWDSSLPELLRPRRITLENGRLLVTYSCRWTASVWSLYQSSLIMFYSKVLSCCQTIVHHDCYEILEGMDLISNVAVLAENNIVWLVETICGSIPYLFGEIDEYGNQTVSSGHKASILYNLIWPLALVTRCRLSTEDQIQLCRDSLRQIGSIYGLNLAYAAEDLVAETLGDF